MLDFYREGSVLTVKVHVNRIGHSFKFDFNAGTEWSAKLLVQAMRDGAGACMEQIRRDAYLEGWRDAKAKRRKQTWFSSQLP